MKFLSWVFILSLWMANLFALIRLEEQESYLKLETLYGETIIQEPVLIELIQSQAFVRLKNIRQYGVLCHARNEPEYTRWQHSLGVFFLTRKYGAPLSEQIAALLHDVSHTVFSHVGDIFYNSDYRTGKKSYQDEIHEQYLKESGIDALLHNYGFAEACSECSKNNQRCFDQPLPGLCADRIEYNLTGAYIDRMITQDELCAIISHLHFENDEWFFDDVDYAKKFGLISLKLSESRWGSTWSAFIDYCAAQALKRACILGIITKNEIQFSSDDIVWEKLKQNSDEELIKWLSFVECPNQSYCVCSDGKSDFFVCGKFSGTDPFVLTENRIRRLSEIDSNYKTEYERVKKLVRSGAHIKLMA
ncbi:MAG TPA: HD domain-containing protein [Candidatus Babeliales bacterium]|nr:HD domain-containing protein [Candidatus Babeliales bacterium]